MLDTLYKTFTEESQENCLLNSIVHSDKIWFIRFRRLFLRECKCNNLGSNSIITSSFAKSFFFTFNNDNNND